LLGSFTGNSIPPSIQSTGNTLTVEFRSDCATQLAGWVANYHTVALTNDITPPVSSLSYTGTWQTQSFTAAFQDSDASGIKHKFYHVAARASATTTFLSNQPMGFFEDEFNGNSGLWTNQSGNFQVMNGSFILNDATQNNSNAYAQVSQSSQHTYLYTWKQRITSSNANQRAGMHFFCSDPTLPNRGNSYFVYFREETDKVQLYKVLNDVFSLVKEDSASIQINQWDQIYVTYNPQSGLIQVYLNALQVCTWTDANPLQQGTAISLRSGACNVTFDEVYVYKNHSNSELITVGPAQEINQQSDQQIPSGKIRVIAMDSLGNWNVPHETLVQVDWTAPVIATLNDGANSDIDSVYQPILEGNWVVNDPHSGLGSQVIDIGSSPLGSDFVQAHPVANNTFTLSANGMVPNQVYYTALQVSNQAGLSSQLCSDGQRFINHANIDLNNPLLDVMLFPNPIQDGQLSIENLMFPVELAVFDLNGRLINTREITNDGKISLDLSAGRYLIKLSGNGHELIKQLIAY
jgi:hypothetical protein